MSPAPALTDFSSRLDKSLTVSLLTFNLPTLIRPFFFPARCFLLLVLVVILVSRFLVKWLNWAKRQPGFFLYTLLAFTAVLARWFNSQAAGCLDSNKFPFAPSNCSECLSRERFRDPLLRSCRRCAPYSTDEQ